MQRLEAGAKAQETTVRILVFVNPRPPHWPDLPHEGLEDPGYPSLPRIFLSMLLGQEGGKKNCIYSAEV